MSNRALRTGLSLMCVSLALAGCASYSGLTTEGARLDAKSLQSAQALKGINVTPAAWPQKDWWKRLGDSQLNGLVDEALRDSPDMQIASARVHQATAAAGAANAARMPTLDAEAD
ncbi:multidrug RND transporter, partial [Pseudomonas sp. FSL R10-0765]